MEEDNHNSDKTTDDETLGFLSAQTKEATLESEAMTEDVQEQVARELQVAFRELVQVRLHLPDETMQYLMQDGEARTSDIIVNKAQDALSSLYTMIRVSNHDAEHHVERAIETTERSQGQVASVNLDVTASPLLPPNEVMEKLENGETENLSYHDIDQLWYAEEIEPERLAEWIVEEEPDAEFKKKCGGFVATERLLRI